MCFFCDSSPPSQPPKAKGARGQQYGAIYQMQNNQNEFALGLKDAPCAEPACCCLSALGASCGFTACWARKKVLDTYYNGLDDYVCCQGYMGCCCISPGNCCRGSPIGLCLEGCCFPMISLSIARIHLMDSKSIRPDPCDWQLIACSNCLQFISCILNIAAALTDIAALDQAAFIVDVIADLFMLSVAGCMGAQVYHETNADLKKKAEGSVIVVHPVAIATPVVVGQPVGGPTQGEEIAGAPVKCEEMDR